MAARAKSKARKKKARRSPRRSKAQAGVCPLTEAPHGDAARRVWEEAVQEALSAGLPCVLALVDVDDFRRHAEELGGERSDAVLEAVMLRAREELDDPSSFGRLAGDLFGVVLTGQEVEQALGHMELVRAAAVKAPVRVGRGVRKRLVEVTLSVGLAALRRDARGFNGLLAQAQAALWRAKSLGGNRVGLPGKERMALKTSYYPQGQLDQLKRLAQRNDVRESVLLREALADLFLKYKDRRPQAQ